jgi:hypothetical protein
MLYRQSQPQVQFEVFTSNTLGKEKSGGVVSGIPDGCVIVFNGEYLEGWAKDFSATETTEFSDPAPAFGAGGKNLKISVRSVAKSTTLVTPFQWENEL